MNHAEINGTRTAFAVAGTGPALLLIHGAEADHSMFQALIPELAMRHTVFAYDQRDSGLTRNPQIPYFLTELAADAAALIDHLGFGRIHVFGTSLGGAIAQVLASEYPDKVNRLVLGSTWRVGRQLTEYSPAVANELGALRRDPVANAALIAAFYFPPAVLRERPELINSLGGTFRPEALRLRRQQARLHPRTINLTKVQAPTLLLAGTLDRLVPAEVTFELSSDIPNVCCESMEGIGHIGARQAPRMVAAKVLAFINTTEEQP